MASSGLRRIAYLGWWTLLAAVICLIHSRWHHRLYSAPSEATLMAERASRVEQVCRRYSHTLLPQYAAWLNQSSEWWAVNTSLLANPDLLVDRERRIAWCKVPKVASTSLLLGFLREVGQGRLLGGELTRGQLHTLLRRLMPCPRPYEDVSFCTAFMVVRHPFQRILSAYRDKFLKRSEYTQFKKFKTSYGKWIIHRHRRQPQPLEYSDVPTFWEFVDYLTDTPVWEYNEHWRPYYFTCTPCHHHYSVILYLENLREETQYLARLTGLRELVVQHDHATDHHATHGPPYHSLDTDQARSITRTHDKDYTNTNSGNLDVRHKSSQDFEKTETFFSQIDERQLKKLYEIYKIDFEMFGYDLSPYDTYVKTAEKEN